MDEKAAWSELPEELLSDISHLLATNDVLAFHSVCKSWHSSSPSISLPRPKPLEIVAAAIDDIIMIIPDAFKECLHKEVGEVEKEEQDKSQGAIFCGYVSGEGKEKVYLFSDRLDEAERVVEVSGIFVKKNIEVGKQNMKMVEVGRIRADKRQKLENFHQLYQSSCSSPCTSSLSSCSQHPF